MWLSLLLLVLTFATPLLLLAVDSPALLTVGVPIPLGAVAYALAKKEEQQERLEDRPMTPAVCLSLLLLLVAGTVPFLLIAGGVSPFLIVGVAAITGGSSYALSRRDQRDQLGRNSGGVK